MNLLLTHGYFLAEDLKEQSIMKPYVPLGLLYLSSHLRARNLPVDIYDSTFGSRNELYSLLRGKERGVLGIYANLLTRGSVVAIIRTAREAGWKVVLGGPEPANYAEEYLSVGADLIVAGEAEIPLQHLVESNFDRDSWSRIGGLIFRADSGTIIRTPAPPLLRDLDRQPWPDRERVDLDCYLSSWRTHHGVGSVSLITARGCPYRCNWCSHSVFGHTHRRRSPRPVVDEVEWILGRYSPDMLWLADDVFTIHHEWLFQYAHEMAQRRIVIPFECITRADRLNLRVVDTLAGLGCFRVWIGSESGSQRILDAMQRAVKLEQVQTAIDLCKQAGIQTGMFLMWGYEGEELEDIENTIEHAKRCCPDVCLTTVSYPIKGTPYYNQISSKLVKIANWETGTDRDLRLRGRHSRNFYRHADELLRSELSPERDASRILAARAGLRATYDEVEA